MLAVGAASNKLGGAGGPLAVYVITIFATEFGKAVSKETKIDILVTPLVTIGVGIGLSMWWAPAIGAAAAGPWRRAGSQEASIKPARASMDEK